MPMNRVQFQPGLRLPAFLRSYGTEAACEQALAHARWPGGFVCPRCGSANAHRFQRFGQPYGSAVPAGRKPACAPVPCSPAARCR